jgi:hypothetical protein
MIRKILKFLGSRKKGSALLVAILVMGILMTLVLGLSQLVFREIRSTSDIVAAGKAYFASEAGVENALLELKENLPGYQTDGWVDREVELYGSDGATMHYQYRIRNQGDAFPFFDEDEPIFINPGVAVDKDFLYQDSTLLENTYNILPLNETVTIPLFTVDESGQVKDIENFMVEYYVNFETDLGDEFRNLNINELDILRWKLFGNPRNPIGGEALRTESISDFYPAISLSGSTSPTCIGTDTSIDTQDSDVVTCHFAVYSRHIQGGGFEEVMSAWSQARECLISDAGNIYGSSGLIKEGCDIRTFVTNHTRNYLTLTNFVNPDLIGINPLITPQKANIHYRILVNPETEENIVREYAKINSDGFSSNDKVKQSIDVELGLKNFLPVFNFTLYRTDTEDPEFSPTETTEDVFDLSTAIGI